MQHPKFKVILGGKAAPPHSSAPAWTPPVDAPVPTSPVAGIRITQYCNLPPAGRRWLLESTYPLADSRIIDRMQYELDDVCNKREWYQRHGMTPPAGQAQDRSGAFVRYAVAIGLGAAAGYWLAKK